jgi:hypothetical protein
VVSVSETASRRRASASRRGCSVPRSECLRIPPPGRPPARSGCTWPTTAGIELGTEIEIEQGSEIGRPSQIRVRVEGSGERIERVFVGGSAVIVARGEYRLE